MQYGPIVPTLAVASMEASLAFYQQVLHFSLKWSWSDDGGFEAREPSFACIECGAAVLFLSGGEGTRGGWLFVELAKTGDVDALAARVGDRAEVVQGPADMPWGSREWVVRDPDGHRLRFSCPVDRRD